MPRKRGPLEQVYDKQVASLLQAVIDVAKAHDMPFYAAFVLDDDIVVTSANLPTVEEAPPSVDKRAFRDWRGSHALRAAHAQLNAIT